MDGNGGEETSSPSPVTSPCSVTMTSSSMHGNVKMNEKVKFFCSHGGKILPRPFDGSLKYVGGETRVIAVPRSITFSELMKKIHDLFDGEYVLKYQLASEDLDSLVSVKSNEDIHHFLDEYDRLEKGGSKPRAYLFPNGPMPIETHTPPSVLGPHAAEQRFIDAINGIVRPTTNYSSRPPTGPNRLRSTGPSPTEGSPQSLSPRSVAHMPIMNQDHFMSGLQNKLSRVHKVRSSPNLSSLCSSGQQSSGASVANSYVHHQQQPHHYHNHGYQMPSVPVLDLNMQSHHRGWESPSRGLDNHSHTRYGHLSPTKYHDPYSRHYPQVVAGGGDYGKASFSHGVKGYHNPSSHHQVFRRYPGSGGHNKWGHLEQYATPTYGNHTQFVRAGSPEV